MLGGGGVCVCRAVINNSASGATSAEAGSGGAGTGSG